MTAAQFEIHIWSENVPQALGGLTPITALFVARRSVSCDARANLGGVMSAFERIVVIGVLAATLLAALSLTPVLAQDDYESEFRMQQQQREMQQQLQEQQQQIEQMREEQEWQQQQQQLDNYRQQLRTESELDRLKFEQERQKKCQQEQQTNPYWPCN
jgi:Mg-chelatase subunit ChlI